MADSSEEFEECLENLLCILEGKGFKIRLKIEQKKAISTKGKIERVERFVWSTF